MDIFSSSKVSSVVGDPSTSQVATNMAAMVGNHGKVRLQQQLNAVGDTYSGRFRDIGDQVANLQKVQAGISAAIDSLKGAKSSVDSLKNLFSQMLDSVGNAANPANTKGSALLFQSQMTTLRTMTASKAGNLLSGPDQRISYEINSTGVSVEVQGQNLGSSYTIAASDGNVWVPSEYGSSLLAYTKYPDTPANVSSGFHGGTKLNSLAADGTIDFSVMMNSATPKNLTGKLVAKGIGVYDSWMYDDLATSAGRARAKTDLDAAAAVAKQESLRYASAADMAQYYYDKIELAIGVLNGEQETLTEEQSQKVQELQDKFKQQQAALALAFQGQATTGVSLLTALPRAKSILSSDSGSDSLIDIFA